MNELKKLNEGAKYSHATVGTISEIDGKIFVHDNLGETSCEISFGTLPAGGEVPFFHSHKNNEENYIILSGKGRFQVDDDVFDIAEGSVVRVATNCDRNLKNTGDSKMTYICIQAKEGSLDTYTMTDAEITQRENKL